MPGRQDMATDWIRNMLCNVLVFPAVIAVFYFAAYLVGGREIAVFNINMPLSPTNTSGALPLFGALDLSFLRKLIAFAAILATPAIPDIICQAIGKPGRAGSALEGAITGAVGQGRSYYGQFNGNVAKVAGDMGTWKERAFGKRQFTGGVFGDIQQRQTIRVNMAGGVPDPKNPGKKIPLVLGNDLPNARWYYNLGNRFERWRRNLTSTTPQSPPGNDATRTGGNFQQQ